MIKKIISTTAVALVGMTLVAAPATADDNTNKVKAVTVTVADSGNTYRTLDAVVKVTDTVGNLVKDATYSVVAVNATVSGIDETDVYGIDTFTLALPKVAGVVAIAVTSNGITVNKLITVTDLAVELAAEKAARATDVATLSAALAAEKVAGAKALADAKAAFDKALADAKVSSDKALADAKTASDKALADEKAAHDVTKAALASTNAKVVALQSTVARLYNWIAKLKALVASLRA